MPNFGDYQLEIYFAGLQGQRVPFPIDIHELEAKAHVTMPRDILSYVAGGAGDERTQRVNVTAFERWGLVPRMLVSPTQRDMSIELFGLKLPSPIFMSPIGVLGTTSSVS